MYIRPLPPIPAVTPRLPDPSPAHASNTYQPNTYRRNSTITIGSTTGSAYTVQTTLPRYSAIDLTSADVPEPEPATDSDSETGPMARFSLSPSVGPPGYFNLPPYGDFTTLASPSNAQGEASTSLGIGSPRKRPCFKLYLKNKGATKPWATLRLRSRPPLSNSNIQTPRFIGGDDVTGVLELKLDKPTSVQNITVNLTGKLMTCYQSRSTFVGRDTIFLDHAHEVYSKKTTGDPRAFGQCVTSRRGPFDEKMQGVYHFPFSFPYPTSTMTSEDGKRPNYELPPSFLEKDSGGTVRYCLGLTIDHGKLKLNNNMTTGVVYVPRTIAPPAPQKRQCAYLEGTVLPAPRSDPEGWKAIRSVELVGRLHERNMQVSCTLYLAEPLCYTRGTVLPCYVALSSPDFQLLEYLASPKMMQVRLSRYVTYQSEAGNITRERKKLCFGMWWRPPKPEEPEALNTRWLEGEIRLSKDLQPSCCSTFFAIEYAVEMMPFPSEIFIIKNHGQDQAHPIISQTVRIATFHQYGPIPTPFADKHGDSEAQDQGQTQYASGRLDSRLLESIAVSLGQR